ncbi:MAG: hypothetical protein C0600_07010, partial [Ignavibacteria bacterium]
MYKEFIMQFGNRLSWPVRTLVLVPLLLVFLGSSQMAEAQPNLNFKRITVNWPTIELYFSVGCN